MSLIKIETKLLILFQNNSKIKNINDDKENHQTNLFENEEKLKEEFVFTTFRLIR